MLLNPRSTQCPVLSRRHHAACLYLTLNASVHAVDDARHHPFQAVGPHIEYVERHCDETPGVPCVVYVRSGQERAATVHFEAGELRLSAFGDTAGSMGES